MCTNEHNFCTCSSYLNFFFDVNNVKLYCETSFHLDILLTNVFFRYSLQRCSIKKLFLKISQNSQENTVCLSLFVNKVAGLRPATLLKKDSGTGDFVKFLRAPFLQNTSGRLLPIPLLRPIGNTEL